MEPPAQVTPAQRIQPAPAATAPRARSSTQDDCSGNYLGDDTSCSGNPCDTSGEAFLGLAYSIVGSNLVDDAEPTWTVDVYAVLGDNCRLDAVAGDTGTSKMVSTTTSFYQNIYGGNTSADHQPRPVRRLPGSPVRQLHDDRTLRFRVTTTCPTSASTSPTSRTVERSTRPMGRGSAPRTTARVMPVTSRTSPANRATAYSSLA